MSYHVRRSERELTEPTELRTILASGKTCILALAKEGEPYLVTLSYGFDPKSDTLYFHCGMEGQKIDFIKANPRTCATVVADDGYDQASCEHSYQSVVFRGCIELVSDRDEIAAAMRLLVKQLDSVDPEAKLSRLQSGDRGFDSLLILKLKVESITGKARGQKGQSAKAVNNV